ncbi:hypothetical protein [Sediminibacterium ginsengisoli]|uniref:MG2 domain-containing protein n=1 Tax=Sediminibacterium ginsengisoli TaxID=413434 RepID=A0A1T4RAH3_9BACT|nr:hypothetical protein [Sediminibacterium ginsengisoli]SKA13014.1 hypothetical protein SAMN04488132_11176 [Sediminibacterium ginsengisoli]
MRKLLIILCLLLPLLGLQAQDTNNTRSARFEQKMRWYGAADKGLLFVHFDKNVYTNNEQAWFTGYLLHPPVHVDSNYIMAVALIRNEDSVVVAEEKYLMADGLSFGNMFLPDSLQPGFYSFVAYTNLVEAGQPRAMFVQPVTIKSVVTPSFLASLKLAPETSADSATVLLKADSKDIFNLISNAEVTYSVGTGKQKISGKTRTDPYGAASITVPVKHLTSSASLLKVQVNHKNEKKQLQIRLPLPDNKLRVGIYPESGHLVAGLSNRVAWEVKTAEGTPLSTLALLYRNAVAVDTVQTNGEGLGTFSLFAEAGNSYSIRVLRKDQPDTLYPLPNPVTGVPLLHIADAVAGDTLRISISAKQPGTWHCMIHNYSELYAGFDVTLDNASARGFRMPLTDIPRGLLTVTLLDASGKPVSERMAFAHYDQKDKISIVTDSAAYHTRQKVTVKLKLNAADTGRSGGMLSVACVQDNRLDVRNTTDIESYSYLNHQLADLPFRKDPIGPGEDNKDYLNNILLVKGWRRYNWQGLEKVSAADTLLANIASLQLKGNVTRFEKEAGKPLSLSFITDSAMQLIITAADGSFHIRKEDLVITPGKKLMFFVNEKNKNNYAIQVTDPYARINRNLLAWLPDEQNDQRYLLASHTDSMTLKAGEKAATLATVTVSANKNDGSLYATSALQGRNACGDYVCSYGILNCMNHSYGTLPVEGKTYRTPNGMGMNNTTVYKGCIETKEENKFMLFVKGVYTAKEFYVADYTKIDPSEQMFLSTLYWNYATVVNSAGETELSFYTSDITGRFRIVAQGITSNGVTHAEASFTVKQR